MRMYVVGGKVYQSGKAVLDDEEIRRVLEEEKEEQVGGKVKWKIRYYSEGLAIGSRQFVEDLFQSVWKRDCPNRKDGAVPIQAGVPELEDLWVYKRMKNPILKP